MRSSIEVMALQARVATLELENTRRERVEIWRRLGVGVLARAIWDGLVHLFHKFF